ncbi:MAG: hypothetical protein ACRDZ5_07695 [Acidimicrobiales bacterium]
MPSPSGAEQVAEAAAGRAVMIDIGEDVGALVLIARDDLAGVEVEVEPLAPPGRPSTGKRTHVALLRRATAAGEVLVAGVFPSLVDGQYRVISPKHPDQVVPVRGGEVTVAHLQPT